MNSVAGPRLGIFMPVWVRTIINDKKSQTGSRNFKPVYFWVSHIRVFIRQNILSWNQVPSILSRFHVNAGPAKISYRSVSIPFSRKYLRTMGYSSSNTSEMYSVHFIVALGFPNGQPSIYQGNQIYGFSCPAFETGSTWIFLKPGVLSLVSDELVLIKQSNSL